MSVYVEERSVRLGFGRGDDEQLRRTGVSCVRAARELGIAASEPWLI